MKIENEVDRIGKKIDSRISKNKKILINIQNQFWLVHFFRITLGTMDFHNFPENMKTNRDRMLDETRTRAENMSLGISQNN